MSSYTIPTVIERSAKGDRVSDVFSRLLSERIVFVGTPIDDGVSNVVVAQLLHLAAEAPDRDISLYINSPGGSFSSTLAIYDTMRFVPCDIATLCVGQAASTAAMLLAAGTPGKRAALPHARVLLHQPHAELSRGSISDLALEAAELALIRGEAEDILASHLGRDAAEVRADTDRALVLRAEAAVSYGVIDEVLMESGSQGESLGVTALRPSP
jgi:ATP-dependent Clp protease protease subunit